MYVISFYDLFLCFLILIKHWWLINFHFVRFFFKCIFILKRFLITTTKEGLFLLDTSNNFFSQFDPLLLNNCRSLFQTIKGMPSAKILHTKTETDCLFISDPTCANIQSLTFNHFISDIYVQKYIFFKQTNTSIIAVVPKFQKIVHRLLLKNIRIHST